MRLGTGLGGNEFCQFLTGCSLCVAIKIQHGAFHVPERENPVCRIFTHFKDTRISYNKDGWADKIK